MVNWTPVFEILVRDLVLVYTNTAGMGVNFKSVNNVVNYGPPHDMDTGMFLHKLVEPEEMELFQKHQIVVGRICCDVCLITVSVMKLCVNQ